MTKRLRTALATPLLLAIVAAEIYKDWRLAR